MKKTHASDLYQYLLNPHQFSCYLYELDPTVSCGITGIDGSTTLGTYIARDLKDRIGAKGSVLISEWFTSWHSWDDSQFIVWAVNPRWVRAFNKRLSRLSGGEPNAPIMPCAALSQLGVALGLEFPESPFAVADEEGTDSPADQPYDFPHDLDNYQFTKITEVCCEKVRYVILSFQLGLIEKYISFNVPQYFLLHVGFQDWVNSKVKNVKITEVFGDNISKIILTFENDHKIAVPNQGGIQVDDRIYDNIPF